MASSTRSTSTTLGQFVWASDGAPLPRESLSTAIADMVARRKGLEPTEGEFHLYDYLDPDAVDALYDHARRHGDASWRLEFALGEDTVVVSSDGVVRLDGVDDWSP